MFYEIQTQPYMSITLARADFESSQGRRSLSDLMRALHAEYLMGIQTPENILAWYNPRIEPSDWTHLQVTIEPMLGQADQINGYTIGTCFFKKTEQI